ncbi:MAG TPA: amidase, partial [Terrimicrobiaceae bacterium]|nr:amidase [Terrimicrobiaceae bacterium]
MNSPAAHSAKELARLIREKKASAWEVVQAHLRQIETVNPRLNAVVALVAERALDEARRADEALARGELFGPLHGVPMTIKDNLDTAGVVSTGGTKGRAAFVPRDDAVVVGRLRAAGAILLGKTNTPELTMAYETDNLVHGRTNNPYDPTLTAGGSSGGAAAIIATGGSAFDIGSDTGGSIRVPSHFCGTVGLMPTAGRIPKKGHILPSGGFVDDMTSLGPMARKVEDLELVFQVIAATDTGETPFGAHSKSVRTKDLRAVFFVDNGIIGPAPEIEAAVRAVAHAGAQIGLRVDETCPAAVRDSLDLTLDLWTGDGGKCFGDVLTACGTSELHPFMEVVMEFCRLRPKASADQLRIRWDHYRAAMGEFMEKFDILISPVCPFAALPHGSTFAEDRFPGFSYTMTHNLTGWPVVVVRGGTTREGLP